MDAEPEGVGVKGKKSSVAFHLQALRSDVKGPQSYEWVNSNDYNYMK